MTPSQLWLPLFPLVLAFFLAASPIEAQETGAPTFEEGTPIKEGDVITFESIERIRPYVPQEFWDHQQFFFWEGMKIEIGPPFRDYSPPPEYQEVTRRFAGQSKIGPGNSLEGYTAGQPFPMEDIDCQGDPQAGAKVIWNFDRQWNGDGGKAHFLYTYFDRGEQLQLFYEGEGKAIDMTGRVEPQYLDKNGSDIFANDKRKLVFAFEVDEPYESRGLAAITYRYKSSQAPMDDGQYDDTWIYLPQTRRVRRYSTKQRTDAISGTDFSFDDLRTFNGIVPHYEWQCLGETVLVAPMNSTAQGYPYTRDHDFGPHGLSFAKDRWEFRHAVVLRMTPFDEEHPYQYKDLYLDKQSLTPLYSFAYDRKGELWKIIWHNHRWSEDDPDYYKAWKGVKEPRDMRIVSDIIANAQTGTGNRIEFWDAHGTPLKSKARVRRYIDIGRLSMGR